MQIESESPRELHSANFSARSQSAACADPGQVLAPLPGNESEGWKLRVVGVCCRLEASQRLRM